MDISMLNFPTMTTMENMSCGYRLQKSQTQIQLLLLPLKKKSTQSSFAPGIHDVSIIINTNVVELSAQTKFQQAYLVYNMFLMFYLPAFEHRLLLKVVNRVARA